MGECSKDGLPWWLSQFFTASAMQETWVQSLGWEDPLEKGTDHGIQSDHGRFEEF